MDPRDFHLRFKNTLIYFLSFTGQRNQNPLTMSIILNVSNLEYSKYWQKLEKQLPFLHDLY